VDRALPEIYEFDCFCLNVAEHTLRRQGKLIPLPPKVFDLLLILIQNNGREILKQELMQLLWPDSHVEESNLTQSVFLLRKSLGQSRTQNPLVVTIPGRGYRFTGKLKVQSPISRSGLPQVKTDPIIRSVAVLPFRVVGSNSDDSYLSLGLADALITKLSHVRQITVRPTSAIVKFSDPAQDPLIAGRELGVDSILNGTLQQDHKRIRVTVQLARVSDGYLVWAHRFEDDFVNIFRVQESISEQVGNALAVKLTREERKQINKRYTDNHSAYQAYLRGRYQLSRWTQWGVTKAIENFTSAIDFDPNYALAYAGLSDAYYILSELYRPPREVMPRAKSAARKALEFDDSLAEAHTSLGLILGFYDWDWLGADREFGQAIDINPAHAPAHLWYGRRLATAGRFDEALAELKLAQQLDPLSSAINAELGRTLFFARRFDQAIAQLHETLELEPSFWTAHMFLGWIYEHQGHYTEATAILHRASTLDKNARTLASLGHVYAVSDKRSEAKKVLRLLNGLTKQQYVSPYYLAGIHVGLGELDEAYSLLERACEDRSEWLVWLNVDPKFDSLRADSRFQDIAQRILWSPGQGVSHIG
jgi:DNA-binding winged helix-turn-helix (wHTH) protein/tetratricopeptide (TPR) repeat protein